MKKRFLAALTALTLAAVSFAGCGDSENSDGGSSAADTTAQTSAADEGAAADESEAVDDTESEAEAGDDNGDLKAPVSDTAIDITQGPTENMLTRSIRYEGDTSRLAAKIKAAQELQNDDSMEVSEKVENSLKIAFIGDSITAGSVTSSSQKTYVNQFTKWWEDNVNLFSTTINAGIGATDSYLAVHRVDAEVLAENPEIIFIEFINDSNNEFYKSTMDSLVRKCLAQPNDPAVVLIEMTTKGGGSPQEVHSEIAEYYGIPVISYYDAVMPEYNAGTLEWDTFMADDVHPNDEGHTVVAQLLINFISGIKDNLDGAGEVTPFDASLESPTGDKYADAVTADKDSELVNVTDAGNFTHDTTTLWNFPNGWATTDGGTYTCEIEFKNLGMLLLKGVGGNMGPATITVDGEEVKTIDGNFEGGWGDYAYNEEIISFDEKAMHTVTVTVPEGKYFEIIRWMIS